jgi:hypothetical protein
VTVTLTLADIGSTSFDFWVQSRLGDDWDVAPDRGSYPYAATPAAQPATVRVTGVSLPSRASTAKAGRVLDLGSIQVSLSTGVMVAADGATCTLRSKSTVLAPTLPGRCAWSIPPRYRGQRLQLTVRATYRGAASTVTVPVLPT